MLAPLAISTMLLKSRNSPSRGAKELAPTSSASNWSWPMNSKRWRNQWLCCVACIQVSICVSIVYPYVIQIVSIFDPYYVHFLIHILNWIGWIIHISNNTRVFQGPFDLLDIMLTHLWGLLSLTHTEEALEVHVEISRTSTGPAWSELSQTDMFLSRIKYTSRTVGHTTAQQCSLQIHQIVDVQLER